MAEKKIIYKDFILSESEDYGFLRAKGLEYIEALSSSLWTDYNIHDPGITILELLCYAITDLGYRTSFDIKDILAEAPNVQSDPDKQGFFTAREILTVNPWTVTDYRKLLVDINGIKNAWLFCRDCPCDEIFLYANCAESRLQFSPATEHKISIKGFYDVLIEFEEEQETGDLNSGKISYNFSFISDPLNLEYATATVEMRLPDWHDVEKDKAFFRPLREDSSKVTDVHVQFISGNRGDNTSIPENELGRALRRPIYATIDVVFAPVEADLTTIETLTFQDVPFTVWFNSEADRKVVKLDDLKRAIEDQSRSGIILKYLEKLKKADAVIAETKQLLHGHRNLCEDFCTVRGIQVEDMAVCADMDLTADADIEEVMAQAYYLIGQYFSPDIRFYSLRELLEKGNPVEEIFEGPQLNNGFIDNDQLDQTNLKKELYTSDIINLIADIKGVTSIRNLVIVRYDKDGNRVRSESWAMPVSHNHQPRLYIEGSKFFLFKNGLPFLPDKSELADTLQVIRGMNSQPQFFAAENNIQVPEGKYYQLNQYSPVQNGLPLTYGTGYEGLPSHVSEERKAQAKQLKAYLLVFEQILVSYLEQLSNVKEIFSLDPAVSRTYYGKFLEENDIRGVDSLYAPLDGALLDQASLDKLMETETTFLDRRNRFLDSLMSRFAEQFTDYALMLYSYKGNRKLADQILINNKISFIKDLPLMTRNRARAMNYKDAVHICDNANIAGLETRIRRLLGLKNASGYFELYEEWDTDMVSFERRWRLVNEHGKIFLSGSTRYSDPDVSLAEGKAKKEIDAVLDQITKDTSFEIRKEKKWVLNLKDGTGETIATRKQSFITEAAALNARDEIMEFGRQILLEDKIFIIEHILLRPLNRPDSQLPNGDPLLSICIPPTCKLCGEEDPYSFRLTIVLNGEAGLANSGISFRRFAEETVRMEIPAHLGLKICWVSTEQLLTFEQLYCAWLRDMAGEEPDKLTLNNSFSQLMAGFAKLKSVYPKATLHDCADGNDENRVYLDQTIV